MNQNRIIELLTLLDCKKIKVGNSGWIQSSCPFAPWTHAGGEDKHPSFGVAIEPEAHSAFKCLSCQEYGDLLTMVFEYSRKSGKDYATLADFVRKNDDISATSLANKIMGAQTPWEIKPTKIAGITVYKKQSQIDLLAEADDTLPEETLKDLSPLPTIVKKYLTLPKVPVEKRNSDGDTPRGLSEQAIIDFELSWDPKQQRIMMPIRDLNGRLVGLSGRAFYKRTKPKFKHSTNFKKNNYLYGEHRATHGKTGILVEGNMDVIALHQHGYTMTVAQMGSYLSEIQILKLTKMFSRVIYIRDGDKAGRDAEENIKKALFGKMRVDGIEIQDGYDPDDLSFEQLNQLLGPPEGLTKQSVGV